jgi:hypothetical protein
MLPPGFRGTDIPNEESHRALPWMASKLLETADRKFAMSVVYTMYTGLTGAEPLSQPLDPTMPTYLQQVRAFDAQDYTFKRLAKLFVDSQYDVRALLKAMVKTPWLRAVNTDSSISDERRWELESMGATRILPPEGLHRKILATVGFSWNRNGAPALTGNNNYKFFYGGIDSINTTTRQTDINGIMNNVAERMSNEVACQATAWDFTRNASDRLLFPYVEATDGLDAETAIRENIRYLHSHILGEWLEPGDPELDRTFDLFKDVLEDGQARLDSGEFAVNLRAPCQATTDRITGNPIDNALTADPDYTVRAWMSVVTYLLGDYRYLFE